MKDDAEDDEDGVREAEEEEAARHAHDNHDCLLLKPSTTYSQLGSILNGSESREMKATALHPKVIFMWKKKQGKVKAFWQLVLYLGTLNRTTK